MMAANNPFASSSAAPISIPNLFASSTQVLPTDASNKSSLNIFSAQMTQQVPIDESPPLTRACVPGKLPEAAVTDSLSSLVHQAASLLTKLASEVDTSLELVSLQGRTLPQLMQSSNPRGRPSGTVAPMSISSNVTSLSGYDHSGQAYLASRGYDVSKFEHQLQSIRLTSGGRRSSLNRSSATGDSMIDYIREGQQLQERPRTASDRHLLLNGNIDIFESREDIRRQCGNSSSYIIALRARETEKLLFKESNFYEQKFASLLEKKILSTWNKHTKERAQKFLLNPIDDTDPLLTGQAYHSQYTRVLQAFNISQRRNLRLRMDRMMPSERDGLKKLPSESNALKKEDKFPLCNHLAQAIILSSKDPNALAARQSNATGPSGNQGTGLNWKEISNTVLSGATQELWLLASHLCGETDKSGRFADTLADNVQFSGSANGKEKISDVQHLRFYIEKSVRYLEKQYMAFIDRLIASFPKEAKVGGRPDVNERVRALCVIKKLTSSSSSNTSGIQNIIYRSQQQGNMSGTDLEMLPSSLTNAFSNSISQAPIPIWAHLFYLIRIGRLKHAVSFVEKNRSYFDRVDGNLLSYLSVALNTGIARQQSYLGSKTASNNINTKKEGEKLSQDILIDQDLILSDAAKSALLTTWERLRRSNDSSTFITSSTSILPSLSITKGVIPSSAAAAMANTPSYHLDIYKVMVYEYLASELGYITICLPGPFDSDVKRNTTLGGSSAKLAQLVVSPFTPSLVITSTEDWLWIHLAHLIQIRDDQLFLSQLSLFQNQLLSLGPTYFLSSLSSVQNSTMGNITQSMGIVAQKQQQPLGLVHSLRDPFFYVRLLLLSGLVSEAILALWNGVDQSKNQKQKISSRIPILSQTPTSIVAPQQQIRTVSAGPVRTDANASVRLIFPDEAYYMALALVFSGISSTKYCNMDMSSGSSVDTGILENAHSGKFDRTSIRGLRNARDSHDNTESDQCGSPLDSLAIPFFEELVQAYSISCRKFDPMGSSIHSLFTLVTSRISTMLLLPQENPSLMSTWEQPLPPTSGINPKLQATAKSAVHSFAMLSNISDNLLVALRDWLLATQIYEICRPRSSSLQPTYLENRSLNQPGLSGPRSNIHDHAYNISGERSQPTDDMQTSYPLGATMADGVMDVGINGMDNFSSTLAPASGYSSNYNFFSIEDWIDLFFCASLLNEYLSTVQAQGSIAPSQKQNFSNEVPLKNSKIYSNYSSTLGTSILGPYLAKFTAKYCQDHGRFQDALSLYHLAGDAQHVYQLLANQLSQWLGPCLQAKNIATGEEPSKWVGLAASILSYYSASDSDQDKYHSYKNMNNRGISDEASSVPASSRTKLGTGPDITSQPTSVDSYIASDLNNWIHDKPSTDGILVDDYQWTVLALLSIYNSIDSFKQSTHSSKPSYSKTPGMTPRDSSYNFTASNRNVHPARSQTTIQQEISFMRMSLDYLLSYLFPVVYTRPADNFDPYMSATSHSDMHPRSVSPPASFSHFQRLPHSRNTSLISNSQDLSSSPIDLLASQTSILSLWRTIPISIKRHFGPFLIFLMEILICNLSFSLHSSSIISSAAATTSSNITNRSNLPSTFESSRSHSTQNSNTTSAYNTNNIDIAFLKQMVTLVMLVASKASYASATTSMISYPTLSSSTSNTTGYSDILLIDEGTLAALASLEGKLLGQLF